MGLLLDYFGQCIVQYLFYDVHSSLDREYSSNLYHKVDRVALRKYYGKFREPN